ncbi:hypothetical protein BT93_H2830 [Corymbia citriodora subsp. variegata]|nr:hypothetical protein BT93_H2830 [Corymbia citriodora subsp. variegata]
MLLVHANLALSYLSFSPPTHPPPHFSFFIFPFSNPRPRRPLPSRPALLDLVRPFLDLVRPPSVPAPSLLPPAPGSKSQASDVEYRCLPSPFPPNSPPPSLSIPPELLRPEINKKEEG